MSDDLRRIRKFERMISNTPEEEPMLDTENKGEKEKIGYLVYSSNRTLFVHYLDRDKFEYNPDGTYNIYTKKHN